MALPQLEQQYLQQDEERNKLQVGKDSSGNPLYLRVSDDGYIITKLMGYDVDGSGDDIQIIVDEEGRLRMQIDDIEFAGDIQVDTDALEQLITDEQANYHLSDWLESGTDVYVGYLTKDGAWIIKKFDTTNGQARYVSGSSGYTFADPASLSYDQYDTEF